ncbi:hypothetical protein KR093_001789, partial [Drosophila rubida]
GTGGSGKSTFVKQMRIIYDDDFTETEKRGYIKVVFQNIFVSMQSMINAMVELEISYGCSENINHANLIMSIDSGKVQTLSDPFLHAIKCLWSDPGIQVCYSRRKEYHLIDPAKYFLSDLERIGSPDYLPNLDDILESRAPTAGINQFDFKIDKLNIRMVDVGGQRTERRKWIHCFENVNLIIFMSAICEYDTFKLEDDHNINLLEESKALFKTIFNYQWFERSAFVLFLNKIDLLEEQIKKSHLVDYYPKYGDGERNHLNMFLVLYDDQNLFYIIVGPKGDAKSAREFILKMFLNFDTDRDKDIYSHFTCA